ncbi:homoserine kinase [Pseudomonas sp. DC3000-4b1]|uniref:homoserine kinase n=1 Tax=unclassified Pseudomonas TaxID=196821 RepID=UPI003CEABFF1
MSVFTPLSRPQLETFLQAYDLGRLRDFQGIAAGTENSNFFVSLEKGEYVLTLVERGPAQDLPFFVELLEVLHQAQLPVPFAIPGTDGVALRELAGKPALLQPRLAGKHISTPSAEHCSELGALLARLHLATRDRILHRRTDRGMTWMLREGERLVHGMETSAATLLNLALQEIREQREAILALPMANVHGDLFRDNAMFEGTRLTGVIDFYNASAGPMLYDVAISLNDWCSAPDGTLQPTLAMALLTGYGRLRPFTRAEAELWPVLLRIACVRFWLSRLIAAQSFAGRDVLIHDPAEFEQRLSQRQVATVALPLTE